MRSEKFQMSKKEKLIQLQCSGAVTANLCVVLNFKSYLQMLEQIKEKVHFLLLLPTMIPLKY